MSYFMKSNFFVSSNVEPVKSAALDKALDDLLVYRARLDIFGYLWFLAKPETGGPSLL